MLPTLKFIFSSTLFSLLAVSALTTVLPVQAQYGGNGGGGVYVPLDISITDPYECGDIGTRGLVMGGSGQRVVTVRLYNSNGNNAYTFTPAVNANGEWLVNFDYNSITPGTYTIISSVVDVFGTTDSTTFSARVGFGEFCQGNNSSSNNQSQNNQSSGNQSSQANQSVQTSQGQYSQNTSQNNGGGYTGGGNNNGGNGSNNGGGNNNNGGGQTVQVREVIKYVTQNPQISLIRTGAAMQANLVPFVMIFLGVITFSYLALEKSKVRVER